MSGHYTVALNMVGSKAADTATATSTMTTMTKSTSTTTTTSISASSTPAEMDRSTWVLIDDHTSRWMTYAEVRQTLRLHEKQEGEDKGVDGGMAAKPKAKSKLSAKALTTAPYLLLYTRETEGRGGRPLSRE